MAITQKDRNYLRELAKRQREHANDPVMAERTQNWKRLNDGMRAVPPVVIETWTFEPYFLPDSLLRCESSEGREIEKKLLRVIREYELLGDDKVVPDYFPIDWKFDLDEFGVPIHEKHAVDINNRDVGFQYTHPIKDLAEDFSMLKPLQIAVRREESLRQAAETAEIFGDILPVRMRCPLPLISLTGDIIRLMGMEALYTALYEQPDEVHMLMRYLTDQILKRLRYCESEGLLTPNNGNEETGASSFGFTDRLSGASPAKLKDLWIWTEAEETVAVSPSMFREFFLPYFAEASAELGRIYYGCCEPLQNTLPSILHAIPHVGKVSVSPWSDQRRVAEIIGGKGIVFSRKPFATYLGLGETLEEDAWRKHIRETVQIARDCPLEIIMRDVYTVKDLQTVRRAIRIAQEEAAE